MTRRRRPAVALVSIAAVLVSGCASAASTAKGRPIYQKAGELLKLPAKHEKKRWPKGTIVAVEKDAPAPFAGILLAEDRAKDAAKLRISYDQLYDVASINSRFAKVVLDVADKQLQDADAEIRKLRKKQNSWWNRNQLSIGLVGGFVFGVSITGLIVWGVVKATK